MGRISGLLVPNGSAGSKQVYALHPGKLIEEIPVKMRLLKPPLPDRTVQPIENHYLVEKGIAERLKNAERKLIYATTYDDLLDKCLTIRD